MIPLTDNDYTLTEGAAWIDVNQFSVRIHTNEDGMVITVYKEGNVDAPLNEFYFDKD